MKQCIIVFLLVFFSLSVKAEANETMEVLLETDYGRIRLEWNETQDAQYCVTVQSIDEKGDIKDLMPVTWKTGLHIFARKTVFLIACSFILKH